MSHQERIALLRLPARPVEHRQELDTDGLRVPAAALRESPCHDQVSHLPVINTNAGFGNGVCCATWPQLCLSHCRIGSLGTLVRCSVAVSYIQDISSLSSAVFLPVLSAAQGGLSSQVVTKGIRSLRGLPECCEVYTRRDTTSA